MDQAEPYPDQAGLSSKALASKVLRSGSVGQSGGASGNDCARNS